MKQEPTWCDTDIQQVYNYLIIKGENLLVSSHDPERISRACYALPSNPNEMEDWVSKHLDDREAEQLYNFLSSMEFS